MGWKRFIPLLLLMLHLSEQEACPVCDSKPQNCRKIQGIYTVRRLSLGYNSILTIPKGACHINVSELKPSANYLALKSSDGDWIINGDWKLSAPGIYPGAGTSFLYSRISRTCRTECVQSQGPLAVNITVQVIYYSTNQGILYDFMLPVNMSFTTFSGEDVINQGQLSPLNATSTFPRSIGVHRNHNNRERNGVPDPNQRRYPDDVEIVTNPRELQKNRQYYMRKVTHRQRPNYIPATVNSVQRQELRSGRDQRYNDINTNYPTRNTSSYNVSRTSDHDNFNLITVDNSLVKNASTYDRNMDNRHAKKAVQTNKIINVDDNPEIRWKAGNWSSCSVPCGRGTQSREVLCQRKRSFQSYVSVSPELCDQGQVPLTTRECYSGPCGDWIVGVWGQCSVRCGQGVQMRTVECKTQSGILLPSSLCTQSAPNETRPCEMGPCQYTWIFSPWIKQCRNTCGNVTRIVRCATSAGSVVADSYCDPRNKPQARKECSNNRDCDREWYSGPWGKCSVTCGSGMKTRDILCISKSNQTILPDSECDSRSRPASQRECVQKDCDSSWFMTDWSKCSAKCNGGTKVRSVLCLNDNKQQSRRCEARKRPRGTKRCNIRSCKIQTTTATTTDSSCVDSYGHCVLVVRARLCKYDYYRQMCCRSCIYQVTDKT